MADIPFQPLNGDAPLHALNGERKQKTVFNAEQVQILEGVFQGTQYLTGEKKAQLAQDLNVTEFTVISFPIFLSETFGAHYFVFAELSIRIQTRNQKSSSTDILTSDSKHNSI